MRDEKICPTCGGPLVWKGNAIDGCLDCAHCAQVEFIEEPAQLAMLRDEEQPTAEEIDANIKSLNRVAGIKGEYAEWDDLCLHDIYMDKASGKDFQREYECIYTGGRRTGRTHGMVLRALEVASRGESVIILVHDRRMVGYIDEIIRRFGIDESRGGAFLVPSSSSVVRYGSIRIAPVEVSPRGVNRGARVFADHAIFECKRSLAFQEACNEWWSRYEIMS